MVETGSSASVLQPDDSSWDTVAKGVPLAIDTMRDLMNFGTKDVNHRRMDDPSKAVGVSFGGGQKVSRLVFFSNAVINLVVIRFREHLFKMRSMPQY
jgi:hypothetical protein